MCGCVALMVWVGCYSCLLRLISTWPGPQDRAMTAQDRMMLLAAPGVSSGGVQAGF